MICFARTVADSPSVALRVSTCLLFVAVFVCPLLCATAARASSDASQSDAAAEVPQVSTFYALPNGLRVEFVQHGETLRATWLMPDGTSYGRGSYKWNPATKSFKGTATNLHVCREGDGREGARVSVLIREELSVVSESELRDLWTKPLSVDCVLGVLEKFKWTETQWHAVKKDELPEKPSVPNDSEE